MKDKSHRTTQHLRVLEIMSDQAWRTLPQICDLMGFPCLQTSISMRLRELRYERFGGWDVQTDTFNGRTFYYRVMPPAPRVQPVQQGLFQGHV